MHAYGIFELYISHVYGRPSPGLRPSQTCVHVLCRAAPMPAHSLYAHIAVPGGASGCEHHGLSHAHACAYKSLHRPAPLASRDHLTETLRVTTHKCSGSTDARILRSTPSGMRSSRIAASIKRHKACHQPCSGVRTRRLGPVLTAKGRKWEPRLVPRCDFV